MSNSNGRLVELDSLRGIAALAVVLYHYFYRYNELYGNPESALFWLYFAKYGAQFFFIISGFVIYWTLNRVEKPLDFIVSRFSRLYPVYWIALIITFAAMKMWGLPQKQLPYTDAFSNLLMFHEYFKIPHVDGVYWTLTVELTFYFWMFTLFLLGQLNRAEFLLIPVVALAVLQSMGVLALPEFIEKLFFINHVSFFIAGICFYKIVHKIANRATIVILLLSVLPTIKIFSLKHFCVFCIFYLCFYVAVSGRLKFLTIKPLIFFGAISYPLYLIHQNIGYLILQRFNDHNLNHFWGAVISLVISISIATVLNKFIEKPSLQLIRNFYKSNKQMQFLSSRLILKKAVKQESAESSEKQEKVGSVS